MRAAPSLAFALAAACWAAPVARADAPIVDDGGACYADVARLCSDRPRGVGERVRCLLERRADLSPACAATIAAVDAVRAAQEEAAQGACREDVARLCRGDAGRGGDVAGCLRPHVEQVSTACRAALGDALEPR